ncbi:MAG: hypothetical protein M1819_005351 [Sarea resinae]|nr:MAG: hypothetical protein M1819_005351 [Sarea resinae]
MVNWMPQKAVDLVGNRADAIWENLQKNNLWKRMFKNVLTTTIVVSICLIPGTRTAFGRAAYLSAIATVFGHPGRRFGMMAEALALGASGVLVGVAWSILGIYLASLVIETNAPAAYTIRGLFLTVVLLVHGFLRSHSPRLFIFVLLLVIVNVVTLTSPAQTVSRTLATQIIYPIFTSFGIIMLINVTVFPEFSSDFLGRTTIDTLNETVNTMRDATVYFRQESGQADLSVEEHEPNADKDHASDDPDEKSSTKVDSSHRLWWKRLLRRKPKQPQASKQESPRKITIKDLTSAKNQLRTKLAGCKSAQRECNFELAVSCLPPRSLKPISEEAMKRIVANTITLIGACESKFALLGEEQEPDSETQATRQSKNPAGGYANGTPSKPELSGGETSGQDESVPPSEDSDEKPKRRKKDEKLSRKKRLQQEKDRIELVKPRREIEFGDVGLARYLMARVSDSLSDLQKVIDRSVEVVGICVAHTYDVKSPPSGAHVPSGLLLEEMDIYIENLKEGLETFDRNSSAAIQGAGLLQQLEESQMDIMPREEIFLVSSFLLNLRHAAEHVLEMMKHCRKLLEQHQRRHGRKTLYPPRIAWKKWLYTGGEQYEEGQADGSTIVTRRNVPDDDDDDDQELDGPNSKENLLTESHSHVSKNQDLPKDPEQDAVEPKKKAPSSGQKTTAKVRRKRKSKSIAWRERIANATEWAQSSEDVAFAIKFACGAMLVIWPSLIAHWNTWYSLNRGLWAALQLVLVTETAIGSSVMTFFLRLIGTTLGCLWGWAALSARNENRIVCAAMIFIGLIPSVYIQLGTKYMKAGMVSIISMCIVVLATELQTVPGSATENFLKRWIAFMIGGAVALMIEFVLFPVKARSKLVDSLAASIKYITEMESCIAYGVEQRTNVDVYSPNVFKRFERVSNKAKSALNAAGSFLPFCRNEPRLKGSFEALALVYGEILFVLHEIVDKMDNLLQLRTAYGSGILEEHNAQVYSYRRNVAGSITITLFAVHEALTTKLPLPQFLPSARLAHLRMINRVREVVLTTAEDDERNLIKEIHNPAQRKFARQKYLSWNATAAAQVEVVEYLEELIDLAKLLVGANEFRSGMLLRPTYRDYIEKIGRQDEQWEAPSSTNRTEDVPLKKVPTVESVEAADLPNPLKRIHTRRLETRIERQKTNESWKDVGQ